MKLTSPQFKKYLNEAQDKFEFKRIQAIYLFVIHKRRVKEISKIVNAPPETIYKWTHLYNKHGVEGILNKRKGGRMHETMSIENEKKILGELMQDAATGLVVTINKIQQKIEDTISKAVSRSYVYDFLRRNGWRKLMPRPRNPKTSKEIQENFKKDFPKLVEQTIKTFVLGDTRPIKVVFEDEGIFGRINKLRRCWAPYGMRPIVPFQMIRQFDHVFSSVCPHSGETFSLILPNSNSQMMNIFLDELSKNYSNFRVVMVSDQAPWHKSSTLKAHDNIRFLYLPAASPELNPTEHLWDHVRENFIGNQTFNSLSDLEAALEEALRHIYHNPESIRSVVSFPWANQNFAA